MNKLAKIVFEAYIEHANRDAPENPKLRNATWDELSEEVSKNWKAAAEAAFRHVRSGMVHKP